MPAAATTELVLQLETSLRGDSNPLRFADGTNLPAAGVSQASAQVWSNDVRVGMVQPLDSPQTRLILTGRLGHRRYHGLDQLSNSEYAARASLEWRLGDLWRGDLSHRDERVLYNYLNGTTTTREMVRTLSDAAEVVLRATPDLGVPVRLQQRKTSYDTAAFSTYNNVERSGDVSVRYSAPNLSTAGAGVRLTQVRYPDRPPVQVASLDDRFTDRELYADADWAYSVKTRASGRISLLSRHYGTIAGKNIEVLTSDLRVTHDYSVLTRLTAELWRRPIALNDANILYTLNQGGQLSARWQATPFNRFGLFGVYEQIQYQQAAGSIIASNSVQHRTRWGGNWVYAFDRNWRLFADGFRETLERGNWGPPIHQNVLRAGVEYTVENLPRAAVGMGYGERR